MSATDYKQELIATIRAVHALGPRRPVETAAWLNHTINVYHQEIGTLLKHIDELEQQNEALREALSRIEDFTTGYGDIPGIVCRVAGRALRPEAFDD